MFWNVSFSVAQQHIEVFSLMHCSEQFFVGFLCFFWDWVLPPTHYQRCTNNSENMIQEHPADSIFLLQPDRFSSRATWMQKENLLRMCPPLPVINTRCSLSSGQNWVIVRFRRYWCFDMKWCDVSSSALCANISPCSLMGWTYWTSVVW